MIPKFQIKDAVFITLDGKSYQGQVKEIRLWRRDNTLGYRILIPRVGAYWVDERQLRKVH